MAIGREKERRKCTTSEEKSEGVSKGTAKCPYAPRLEHEDDDDIRIFLSILSLYVQVKNIQIFFF